MAELKNVYVKKRSNDSWNFKAELIKYSNYKVEVLAKASLQFLRETINFQIKFKSLMRIDTKLILHPFSRQVTTGPSYVYKMFKNYCLNQENIYSVPNENTSNMRNTSRPEIEFVNFMEDCQPELKFQHAFSDENGQKKFGNYDVDLFSAVSKEIYQLKGCNVHNHLPEDGCSDPKRISLTAESSISIFNKSVFQVQLEEKKFNDFVSKFFSTEVESIYNVYECQWADFKATDEWKECLKSGRIDVNRPSNRMKQRTALRGGLIDQYNLMWSKEKNPTEIFKVADINGLYAFVAMTFPFPVGKPIVLIGKELKNVAIRNNSIYHNDKVLESGLMHCQVLAPQDELMPFLQFRLENKFNYLALCRTCASELTARPCLHKAVKSRSFTSVWTIIDLTKALREGYTITDIYEIHYFNETKFLLQNFVQCLSSERLKNSGGLDKLETLEEKIEYCEKHNEAMKLPEAFKLTIDNVVNNPTQKMLFKDLSNSLFGKFGQNSNQSKKEIVYLQHRLEQIALTHEILDIYNINDNSILVEFAQNNYLPDRKGNVYIAAEINARARVIIHDYIRLLQTEKSVKIYSCDTDCLSYSISANAIDPLTDLYSDILGQFKSVIPKDCDVFSYQSLGNRNYSILCKDKENKLQSTIKVKGLCLTSCHFEHNINATSYQKLIDDHFHNEIKSMTVPQVRTTAIKPCNHMERNFRTFEFRNDLFLKRYVKKDTKDENKYVTFPYGFKTPKCDIKIVKHQL